MKNRLFLCSLVWWMLSVSNVSAASYTITIPAAPLFSLIASELDNGAGNSFSQLFPMDGSLDGDALLKYRCDGTYTTWVFDAGSPTGFTDSFGNPIPDGTLAPGEGAFSANFNAAAFTLTFTGALPVPVLPASLPCGCGELNMLSRHTLGTGTYENVTGMPPQEGSQVQRWNGAAFVTNTFSGGAWSLGAPTILNIGEAGLFLVPCAEKWEQIPDTSTNGLDVLAAVPRGLADDFRCTTTGPITQIRLRGSWLNDNVATQACFCLGIFADIPRQGTNYSRPGQLLCGWWCF